MPSARQSYDTTNFARLDSDDDDANIEILQVYSKKKKTSKEIKAEEIDANSNKKSLVDRLRDVTLISHGSTSQEVVLLSDDDDDDRIFIDEEEETTVNRQEAKMEVEHTVEHVEIQVSSESSNSNTRAPSSVRSLTETAVESRSAESAKLEVNVAVLERRSDPRIDRRKYAVKASRRLSQDLLDSISNSAKSIRRTSSQKDKLTIAAEKRREREAQTRARTSNIRCVADRITSLTWKEGEGRSFNDLHNIFEALLSVNAHYTSKYCESILIFDNDKFLEEIARTAPECTISKLDDKPRNRAVEVVTRPTVRKALKIPRGSPAIKNVGARPFSFAKWTNEHGELTIRFEKRIAEGQAILPLGVVFDGERFFFSGGDRIFSCDEDGNNLVVRLDRLSKPSALCVINPGTSIGFLEHGRISIYYKHGNDVKVVADNIRKFGNPRGLAYVSCGALVTAIHEKGTTTLYCYDTDSLNKVKATYRYGLGSPSFMSSYDDIIYVTDLDNRTIRSFKIEKIEQTFSISPVNDCKLETLAAHLKCSYPSGIVCDSRRELLVVDARHGEAKVIWGDAFLQNWKKVNVQKEAFPYCSQIAVSPSGTLFAACRRSHCFMIFKIMP